MQANKRVIVVKSTKWLGTLGQIAITHLSNSYIWSAAARITGTLRFQFLSRFASRKPGTDRGQHNLCYIATATSATS